MYEAPTITKVGSLRDLTLGNKFDTHNQDDSWFWPTSDPSNPGSR